MINAAAQRRKELPTHPPPHIARGRGATAHTAGLARQGMPKILYRRRNPSPNISRAAGEDTSTAPRGVMETRRDLAQKQSWPTQPAPVAGAW